MGKRVNIAKTTVGKIIYNLRFITGWVRHLQGEKWDFQRHNMKDSITNLEIIKVERAYTPYLMSMIT